MNNYIKEIKAIVIIAFILFLIFGIIHSLTIPGVEFWSCKIILGYITLCGLAVIFKKIFRNKNIDKIAEIILIPGQIFYFLTYFIIPFGTLIMHLIFYIMISFLTLFITFELLHKFEMIPFLTLPTIRYIEITLSVFIAVLFNYQIRRFIYYFSPARIHTSQKLKPFELDKLTDYFLSEKNIRFLIYSIYVVVLTMINFEKFQENALFDNSILDDAILQSFLTFIAFDKVLLLLKSLEFKPSDLLLKIKASIFNKIEALKKDGF